MTRHKFTGRFGFQGHFYLVVSTFNNNEIGLCCALKARLIFLFTYLLIIRIVFFSFFQFWLVKQIRHRLPESSPCPGSSRRIQSKLVQYTQSTSYLVCAHIGNFRLARLRVRSLPDLDPIFKIDTCRTNESYSNFKYTVKFKFFYCLPPE